MGPKNFFENAINLTKISFQVSIFEKIKYLALNHVGMSCVPSLMSRVPVGLTVLDRNNTNPMLFLKEIMNTNFLKLQ